MVGKRELMMRFTLLPSANAEGPMRCRQHREARQLLIDSILNIFLSPA
jgi:hypothetical protein